MELATLRHCAELLWLTPSGDGWLEEKIKKIDLNKKIWFESNKSDFFDLKKKKIKKIANPGWNQQYLYKILGTTSRTAE